MNASPMGNGTIPRGPCSPAEELERLTRRFLVNPLADARHSAWQRGQAAHQAALDEACVAERRGRLWRERGRRYQGCTLHNFNILHPGQREVVAAVRAYAANLLENVRAGVNLLLAGGVGTGKDHLLASLFEPALAAGLTVRWASGAALWAASRDRIDAGSNEGAFVAGFVRPDVLALSDLVPGAGELSAFQRALLYQVVDDRYNDRRPVWCALNASGPGEVERALGAPIVDRLRDGAVSLACNWPSYRQPATRETFGPASPPQK